MHTTAVPAARPGPSLPAPASPWDRWVHRACQGAVGPAVLAAALCPALCPALSSLGGALVGLALRTTMGCPGRRARSSRATRPEEGP